MIKRLRIALWARAVRLSNSLSEATTWGADRFDSLTVWCAENLKRAQAAEPCP